MDFWIFLILSLNIAAKYYLKLRHIIWLHQEPWEEQIYFILVHACDVVSRNRQTC